MKSIKPVRLQRKRVKGFKLISPNGLPIVYVGRPSKWGNPFDYRVFFYGRNESENRAEAVRHFELFRLEDILDDIEELRGKNLSCFCPLNEPCHADILLELANQEQKK